MIKIFNTVLILLCMGTASALPLTWRADWPDAKPVETLVHRGTDIELQPSWYINKAPADTNGWTYTTFCQTNAVGPWFGPLPGAFFSHTNDVGAAFYNVMVRAQTPAGAVNYTAFARLRMLDSPGFAPGELPLPVSTIDFSKVVALNAPWLLPAATNDIGAIKGELGSLSNSVSTVSAAAATNSAAIATINSKIPSAASASNQLADKEWIDDEIDTYAAYYITYTAAGAAFPTRAALTNATVVYSGGAERTPTRNDYAVVLADELHGGAEWRYIYTVAEGTTSGQWDAQYPIETNDYDGLSNKPQINGVTLSGNKGAEELGLVETAELPVVESNILATAKAYTDAAAAALSAADAAISRDATNYTDSAIGAAIANTNPTFSNAVLSVGLGIDTNTVAAINALVEAGDELPIGGAATVGGLLLALAAAVAALKRSKADASALRYDLASETVINTASQETVEGETVNYGAATLADRTGNRVSITATLDELRVTFPPAVSGKLRDFGLRVEVGTGSAALTAPALVPVAPTGETIKLENNAKQIPALADGAAAAKGVTLLYFSESAPEVFFAKGEQVGEVA